MTNEIHLTAEGIGPGNRQPKGMLRKIITFPLTKLLIGFVFVFGSIGFIPNIVLNALAIDNHDLNVIIYSLLLIATATVTYLIFTRLVEQRSPKELSLQNALPEFIKGVALASGILLIMLGFLWIMGYYTIVGTNSPAVILIGLVTGAASSYYEEMVFRLILFRFVEELAGSWVAIVISALIFGFMHIQNPGATIWSATSIALQAGILLAAAFILTRRLWLAWGIHFGWNTMQAAIFGFPLTYDPKDSFLVVNLSGPDFLTGGATGLEASPIPVFLWLLVSSYILFQCVRRQKMLPPLWRSK